MQRVQVSYARLYWVLLGLTGFDRVVLHSTRLYWVFLPSFGWVLLDFAVRRLRKWSTNGQPVKPQRNGVFHFPFFLSVLFFSRALLFFLWSQTTSSSSSVEIARPTPKFISFWSECRSFFFRLFIVFFLSVFMFTFFDSFLCSAPFHWNSFRYRFFNLVLPSFTKHGYKSKPFHFNHIFNVQSRPLHS